MDKTKIEWCDYTINPVKGLCPVDCKDNQGKSYCYARRMYKRFKWNPEIRYENLWIPDLANIKKPSRIFVGSTIELFGEWVKYWWLKTIFDFALLYPQHTFIFLTKKPENLVKWSPFPENCWVGVSAGGAKMVLAAGRGLEDIKASVKFLSLEPLLSCVSGLWLSAWLKAGIFNWVIIGQQTPVKLATMPQIEWVKEIVEASDKANIPVFLKENLERIFGYPLPEWAEDKILNTRLRQEFPVAVKE